MEKIRKMDPHSNATFAWTPPEMQSLVCVAICSGKQIAFHTVILISYDKCFISSWPCLHQWLETKPNNQVCPVCKAVINKDKVVPLYGRGSTNQQDPREKLPPRPSGQRTEPEPGSAFSGKYMLCIFWIF